MKSSKNKKWFLDSGCSRHMTGNKRLFLHLKKEERNDVVFGDNGRGKVKGIGSINVNSALIKDVLYVDGLKYNLLSISQLCDYGYKVIFLKNSCEVLDEHANKLFCAPRSGDVYVIDLKDLSESSEICLQAKCDDSWMWHRRLGHCSMDLIRKLVRKELLGDLPNLSFSKNKTCGPCQLGKQAKTPFKPKSIVSTTKPLELLHMDLFGPNRVASLGGKLYAYVIVDDYSRFTWVSFLKNKSHTFETFKKFSKKIQNEIGYKIIKIRSDQGKEFVNNDFENLCDEHGYSHNFSAPRTPQQNGVAERKNRTLQEMGRTMLGEYELPEYFWAEAINTACHITNRVLIRKILNKTPYELMFQRKPKIKYFRVF